MSCKNSLLTISGSASNSGVLSTIFVALGDEFAFSVAPVNVPEHFVAFATFAESIYDSLFFMDKSDFIYSYSFYVSEKVFYVVSEILKN